jgi:hypothetical protein
LGQREQRMMRNYQYAKKNMGWILLSNIFSQVRSSGASSSSGAADFLKGILPGILGSERMPAWVKWLAGFFESLWSKFGNQDKKSSSENV